MAKLFSIQFADYSSKKACHTQIQKVYNWIKLEFGLEHRIQLIEDSYSWTLVVGFTDSLNLKPNNGYLGFISTSSWNEFGDFPDGNYFIYRRNEEKIEIVSDYVASRSVWYYFNENFFCFSTMQIPVIVLLNSFEFNEQVVPWFLSSGTLGLNNSWDSRIKFLPRNSCLEFNFFNSNLEIRNINSSLPSSTKFNFKGFIALLADSLSNIKLDPSKSIHLLSGGIESRLLVSYLAKPFSIPTLTWGTKKSEKDRNSEINVAKRISGISNLPHQTVHILNSDGNIQEIFNEYLKYGEGRVDHILGYIDGFGIWKGLRDSGVECVIRGDQSFGRKTLKNEVLARKVIGCELVEDFNNLKKIFIDNHFQNSDYLKKERFESLVNYSKRIGLEFRHPVVNAALSDLKLGFVEIANPLLNRKLLEYSEFIPKDLALNKIISKKINEINFKGISYSKNRDGIKVDDLLIIKLKYFIKNEIMSFEDKDFEDIGLSSKYIRHVCENISSLSSKKTFFEKSKSLIPKSVKQFFYTNSLNSLPNIRLLLRVIIIIEMKKKISLALS